ncbi:MAG: tetratricopeptide repeat protein, partial [Stellaceae bacterium]
MSTVGMLHLTPDTVPTEAPYLSAEPARAALWAERLGSHGFKVGIVWQGAAHDNSAPLATLAPLAAIPGLRLISLQQQPGAAEIASLPFATAIENPLGSGSMSADSLLDTAAIMANLDAVVSIDSWPAHLAGALGKPVLLALPLVPDWRWLLNRDDTPWYPTMRLYRQQTAGEWADVFEAIARDLTQDLTQDLI